MERLTFEGNFCDITQCAEMHDCDYGEKKCSQRKAWERLKQYEDTGLSPQEVDALKEENARLHNENFWLCGRVNEVNGFDLCKECDHVKEALRMMENCKEDNPYMERKDLRGQGEIWDTAFMCAVDCVKCAFHIGKYGERRIDNAPVLDAEPVKRGKWIDLRESYNDVPKAMCSECGMVIIGLESEHRTCPRCNVEMETERRSEDAPD